MAPTAISQLIEAMGKLILGVLFARFAIKAGYGIPEAAAFAILGLSIGALLSALYLIVVKVIYSSREKMLTTADVEICVSKEGTIGSLLRIAVPITLSSAALSLTRITDMALIMRRLQDIGYTSAGASAVYGAYTTLAVPVFGLVPSLITPVALALVPALSAAIERADREKQSEVAGSSLRITAIFAIPASVGVTVYARPILNMLFSGEPEAVALAAPLLSVLGISIFFSCVITTANAVLQSYRKTSKPIISMAVGAAVKIVSAYIMIGIPDIGVWGAPLSTLLCDITITAIDIYYINKIVPRSESVKSTYLKPFFASLAMITVSYAVYMSAGRLGGGDVLAFAAALVAALLSYIPFIFVFGAVTERDILLLPVGGKALGLARKVGLLKSIKQENDRVRPE